MTFMRNKTGWFFRILSIYIAIVLIYLAAIPSEYIKSGISHRSDSVVTEHFSFWQETCYLTGYSSNEILNDIESRLISTRNFYNFNNNILRTFYILLPFVGFGVLAYCLGYFIRRKKKHKSILAISLGGHAPPKLV